MLCIIHAVHYLCGALSMLCITHAVHYPCCALPILCIIHAVHYSCCACKNSTIEMKGGRLLGGENTTNEGKMILGCNEQILHIQSVCNEQILHIQSVWSHFLY